MTTPPAGPWVLVIGCHRSGTSAITGALAEQADQPPKTFPDDPDLQAESQGQSPIDAVLLRSTSLRTVTIPSPALFTKVTSTASDAAGLPTPYIEGAPSTTADELTAAPSTAAAEPGEVMSSWWFWLIILVILIVILGLAIGLYYRARRI